MHRSTHALLVALAVAAILAGSSGEAPANPAIPLAGTAPTTNVTIGTSSLVQDVKALGIDLTKSMESLSKAEKIKLMPLLNKALGMSCIGCHEAGDYGKQTPLVAVSRRMWDEYVVALRDTKGSPVFCDTCHQGHEKLLARTDGASVNAIMATDYAGKLARADKKPNDCKSCHGPNIQPKIIAKLWGIALK